MFFPETLLSWNIPDSHPWFFIHIHWETLAYRTPQGQRSVITEMLACQGEGRSLNDEQSARARGGASGGNGPSEGESECQTRASRWRGWEALGGCGLRKEEEKR